MWELRWERQWWEASWVHSKALAWDKYYSATIQSAGSARLYLDCSRAREQTRPPSARYTGNIRWQQGCGARLRATCWSELDVSTLLTQSLRCILVNPDSLRETLIVSLGPWQSLWDRNSLFGTLQVSTGPCKSLRDPDSLYGP